MNRPIVHTASLIWSRDKTGVQVTDSRKVFFSALDQEAQPTDGPLAIGLRLAWRPVQKLLWNYVFTSYPGLWDVRVQQHLVTPVAGETLNDFPSWGARTRP